MSANRILFTAACVAFLGACASGGGGNYRYDVDETAYGYGTVEELPATPAITPEEESALAMAESQDNLQEALRMMREIYNEHPEDSVVAVRYARLLRTDDQIQAASTVLKPFATGSNANPEAMTEMAMTQLALGSFSSAESYANRVIGTDPRNARAYLALGTALDAQTRHEEAEAAFREGLKYWKGDTTPIMNNLALNLASQGHLREALALIEKAQELAPNRMDLERNKRIISTLLETSNPDQAEINAAL